MILLSKETIKTIFQFDAQYGTGEPLIADYRVQLEKKVPSWVF